MTRAEIFLPPNSGKIQHSFLKFMSFRGTAHNGRRTWVELAWGLPAHLRPSSQKAEHAERAPEN